MPQINSALRHFYRKNPESVEISLESIGESPQKTRPTVLVVCTSVSKVRGILKKKLGTMFDGAGGVALKVCRGQVLRSRKDSAKRSKAKSAEEGDEVVAANPDYQERPKNGASIGAWIGDRHLPPVSLGGLIMVDDMQYGMTVHHMLDDPEQAQPAGKGGAPRSMAGGIPDLAAWYAEQYQNSESGDSSGSEDYACEFSDSESDSFSESAITSEYSEEDEEDEQYTEPGDIPGIEPGCGDGYIITQPALDDVPEGFYPSSETQDEDHLDTYSLGEIYASSGIRRRTENGLLHEIDWALFEFSEDRHPDGNSIPHIGPSEAAGHSWGHEEFGNDETIHPTTVVPSSSLPGLEVQCMARTSGLQTGVVLQAVASVKIYGRTSPSHIYQVSGTHSSVSLGSGSKRASLPMGIPGDSGAWVVDRDQGAVCGHILAWSERKRVAYICPMDVLLLDIAETLEANEIRLPGGEVVFSRLPHKLGRSLTQSSRYSGRASDFGEDDEDASTLMSEHQRRQSIRRSQLSKRGSLWSRKSVGPKHEEEDSYDEGLEVQLPQDLKELHISEDVSVEARRWGLV